MQRADYEAEVEDFIPGGKKGRAKDKGKEKTLAKREKPPVNDGKGTKKKDEKGDKGKGKQKKDDKEKKKSKGKKGRDSPNLPDDPELAEAEIQYYAAIQKVTATFVLL